MSRYIRILNEVKLSVGALSLTPSQAACYKRMADRLTSPVIVNLHGLHGSGKTVLGWAMEARGHATYIVHPSRLQQVVPVRNSVLFVDNAEADRPSFRALVGLMESIGIDRAIVATLLPVDDYIFRAELTLTNEDIEVVRQNLTRLGYPTVDASWTNLWQGLLQAAKGE